MYLKSYYDQILHRFNMIRLYFNMRFTFKVKDAFNDDAIVGCFLIRFCLPHTTQKKMPIPHPLVM